MFGLERDFIQQDGITMLLGRTGGLSTGDLNMVQARMLMNSGIPHHLRLLLREIDMQVTLEYTVSKRKMLGTLLKSGRLSMTEFFGLLLQIAAGMEEGRLYMLRPEQYALHQDYIFIEGPLGSGRVFLTCIPLQGLEPALKPGEPMKSLIMVFMAAIRELSGDGIQRLLQYCDEETFSPAGLKELLAELLTGGESQRAFTEAHDTEHTGISRLAGAAFPAVTPDQRAIRTSWTGQAPPPLRDAAEPALRPTPDAARPWGQGERESEPHGSILDKAPWMKATLGQKLTDGMAGLQPSTSDMPHRTIQTADEPGPYRIYVLLGALLCDALLWKFLYLDEPKLIRLVVCAALTVGLAFLSWLVWSGRLFHSEAEDEGEVLEDEIADRGNTAWNRRLRSEAEWDFGRNPVVASRPAPSEQEASFGGGGFPGGPAKRTQAPISLDVSTPQTMEPVKPTALLTREPVQDSGGRLSEPGRTTPYLERTSPDEGGAFERIELNRPSFIIGRSAEVAQYVEASEGASRVHVEISRISGGYILKDLDSRNGTLFAGEAMVPYKEYPLTEGAVFKIVKGTYTFRSA
ncbi:DUF6382 domain-containing protein [Paenibacillus piscarius]|uniref:DUF6382 domain-containing protein n=1 Tax=Paenibacillus piscarius TaxID=1089681 RepID=UPI001EE8EE6D|nr:DUF6382 domain-containing protein [Paenibacillus piscarius]